MRLCEDCPRVGYITDKTRCLDCPRREPLKDENGKEVKAGDLIRFGFGIPPIGVTAKVVERNGKLVALTPEHKPTSCPMKELKRHVGSFLIIEPTR